MSRNHQLNDLSFYILSSLALLRIKFNQKTKQLENFITQKLNILKSSSGYIPIWLCMHKWYIPFFCKVSKGGNPFNNYYSADNKWILSFPNLRCITRSRRTSPQYREIYRAETFISSVYDIFNMYPALQVSCFLSRITDCIIILWRAKWNIWITFTQGDIFHSNHNSIFNRTLFLWSFTFWDSSFRLHYRPDN